MICECGNDRFVIEYKTKSECWVNEGVLQAKNLSTTIPKEASCTVCKAKVELSHGLHLELK